jgi:hypothetical protein
METIENINYAQPFRNCNKHPIDPIFFSSWGRGEGGEIGGVEFFFVPNVILPNSQMSSQNVFNEFSMCSPACYK